MSADPQPSAKHESKFLAQYRFVRVEAAFLDMALDLGGPALASVYVTIVRLCLVSDRWTSIRPERIAEIARTSCAYARTGIDALARAGLIETMVTRQKTMLRVPNPTGHGRQGRPVAATEDQVLELLPADGASFSDWRAAADERGITEGTFRRRVRDLNTAGRVKRTGNFWTRCR